MQVSRCSRFRPLNPFCTLPPLFLPFHLTLITISPSASPHQSTNTVQLKVSRLGSSAATPHPNTTISTTTPFLSVKLTSNFCSSPQCFLSGCFAHIPQQQPLPPQPFPFFLSTSIMALNSNCSFKKMLSVEVVTHSTLQ